ncbi:site-specific recombinase [Kaistia sp. 32K]|uniref:recombinase family protein n=1 Tax=Kaistia sp. 32K TaxID=2795690 RepID=UPI0019152153|nr:recombinase family protein [Kaistia sp. 32K]BCP55819.1 site-specific recombinase [Kaistia sp. 32K]
MMQLARAYSYIRMSSEAQILGDSRRRQIELSQVYARDHGLELDEDFRLEDLGISAFKGANASEGALSRFLEAIKSGRISAGSYLLVESLDRISRQQVSKSLALFLDIISNGITIVTLADGRIYGSTPDTMDLMYSILIMGRAHEESDLKSRRVAAAWESKRTRGSSTKLTAQCPAWLVLKPDRSGFDEIESRTEIVRRIFEESEAGQGAFAIARRLNQDGIPTFGNSQGWHSSSVKKILVNRSVLGCFQPHRLIDGKRIPTGDEIADYYPQIVAEDLFYRARAAAIDRRVGSSGRKGEHVSNLFSGLARCAYCKGTLHFLSKGKPPKGGTYIRCSKAIRALDCTASAWRYDDFEASFLALVTELDLEPIVRAAAGETFRRDLERQVAAKSGEIAIQEENRERAFELYMRSKSEYFSGKVLSLDASIVQAKTEFDSLHQQLNQLDLSSPSFYAQRENVQNLIRELQDRSAPDTYRLRSSIAAKLKNLIHTLEVSPDSAADRIEAKILRTRELEGFADHPDAAEIESIMRMPRKAEQQGRYFAVKFKNGAMRIVFPDDDPFELRDEIVAGQSKAIDLDVEDI